MKRLIERAEQRARAAQRRCVSRIADHLRTTFGSGTVEAREDEVLIRGKGIIKRWLVNPRLRFIAGGLK